MVFQEETDGIAQAANADLKRGAVLNERNDFIRNGFFCIRNRDLGQFGDLMVLLADIINVLNVYESFLGALQTGLYQMRSLDFMIAAASSTETNFFLYASSQLILEFPSSVENGMELMDYL